MKLALLLLSSLFRCFAAFFPMITMHGTVVPRAQQIELVATRTSVAASSVHPAHTTL